MKVKVNHEKTVTEENSLPDDLEEYRQIFMESSKTKKFCSNKVETAKYTLLTWLPKSVILQFARINNIYFLIVTILCFFPFSPYFAWSYAGYFIFILMFTSIKDGIEDISRHKQDRKVNKSKTRRFNYLKSMFEEVDFQDVKVGNIIKVHEDESFPADLVFLSSNLEGICYVNTMNLDGETNLKEKIALNVDFTSGANEKVLFEVEKPKLNLHKWQGIFYKDGSRELLELKHLLLRGCNLKNTEWVIGIVAYTGKETKVIMNGQNRISKISTHQKKVNIIVLSVLGVLVLICFIFAVVGQTWTESHTEIKKYLDEGDSSDAASGLYLFFSYWILFSSLIPLSLYLFIEVQRLIICSFIPTDLNMYYAPNDATALWRTSDVVEELGRVEFIFSDKTGTLTSNQMILEKFYINGSTFDVNSDIDRIKSIKNTKKDSFNHDLLEMLYIILICNSVFPTLHQDHITYHSVSPDETALVEFGTKLGMKILEKKKTFLKIHTFADEEWRIKLEVPFSSDRKRMTVIAKAPDGDLHLFIKGADEVILPLLSSTIGLDLSIQSFAKQGLRTLILASKKINRDWFKNWNKHWKSAVNNSNYELQTELLKELEHDIRFCAITAIEDKLQDNVPETIEALIKADIRVWVITGDKEETAIEIAKSCNLIMPDTHLVKILEPGAENIKDKIMAVLKRYDIQTDLPVPTKILPVPHSVVLNGLALSYIKNDENLCSLFFILSYLCKSVICCRMSPAQKSEIVGIVKKRGKWVTLSIGDGANDVSMLKEANVGVGVCGKEGTQALLASDFVLNQFSHLKYLLFAHGRYAYSRISTFTLYYFYTDYMLQICQTWLTFYDGFSSQIFYLDWLPSFYNIFVMSLPVMASFSLDQDIPANRCLDFTNLYSAGQKGAFFNMRVFWKWVFWTIVGGSIVFWIPMSAFYDAVGSDGRTASLFWSSSVSYIMLIAAINWKLLIITRTWNYIFVLSVVCSFGIMYFFCGLLTSDGISIYLQPEYQRMLPDQLSYFKTWVVIIVGSLIAVLPDFIIHCISQVYFPSPTDKVVSHLSR